MFRKFSLIALLSFILISVGFVYLSTWTFGVEGDHAGYWQYSWITPLGDFESTGKSPVFYTLNHTVTHSLGPALGNRQNISINLFYIFIAAVLFSYFFYKKHLNFYDSFLPAIALWLTPLFYFFLTQFMMETPLLILVFVFCYFFYQSIDLTKRSRWLLLFTLILFSISIKETVLAAIFLVLFWQWLEKRTAAKNLLKIVTMVVLAFVVFKIIITKYQDTVVAYLIPIKNLNAEYFRQKISYYPRVVWTYIWFLVPALILGVFSKSRRKFFLLFAFGFLLASTMHFVSTLNSQRYYAPLVAAVLIISFLAYEPTEKKLRNFLYSAIIIFNLFFITSNYFLTPFSLWPKTVQREHIESGASVLYGFPTYRWLISHGRYDEQLCVYVPTNNGEMNYYIERALPGIFGNNAMAIHTTLAEAEKCPHSGIMYRSYDPPPQELFDFCKAKNLKMYEGRHRITYFSLDGHKTEENPGYLYNLTCI